MYLDLKSIYLASTRLSSSLVTN
uniref:Uncharacterized protein n=1 Tax=Anguilla anguilla TaxID=7936 RepID=A0A0E9T3C9_ANGAN